jgi:hypothetical protein
MIMCKWQAKIEYTKLANLYKFIRLVLGSEISDRAIATRWRMDEKNFHQLKIGEYPVPPLRRLISLAHLLGINKHLVIEVALGTPAAKVFKLIKTNNRTGQIELLMRDVRKT